MILDVNKTLILEALNTVGTVGIGGLGGLGGLGALGAYTLNNKDNPVKPKQPDLSNEKLPMEQQVQISKDPSNVQYEGPDQSFLDDKADTDLARTEMLKTVKNKWGNHILTHPEDKLDGSAYIKFRDNLTQDIKEFNSSADQINVDNLYGLT